MAYVSVQDLLAKTKSMYKLVVLASMRAVELNNGAARLIEESSSEKVSTIALEEIAQDKVKLKEEKQAKK
jgi:DNA-directed RNA polymerase omega subunit